MSDACYRREVLRPNVEDVHKLLLNWGGIVVHFSGVPAGVSSGLNLKFPDDLKHILNGNAQGGISCSTVRPGDVFEDPETNKRNSWGCIGVIVRSRSPWSLVCVDSSDCGSKLDAELMRDCMHADGDISLAEVAESLESRQPDDCNEWVMRDFDCLGVLVQPPFSAREFWQFASREEILREFGSYQLYTIAHDGLYEVSRDFILLGKVDISQLYPANLA